MGKVKFIVGTILFALVVITCFAGTYLLYYATHIKEAAETIVAIIAIPIGLICYGGQIVFGVVSEILLWNNFRKNGCCKTASLVIAISGLVLLAFSAGYLGYIFISNA